MSKGPRFNPPHKSSFPCIAVLAGVAARLLSAEERRARGRARGALRHLTRRGCPNVVSAANAVSSATRPRDRAPQGSRNEVEAAQVKCRGACLCGDAARGMPATGKSGRHPAKPGRAQPPVTGGKNASSAPSTKRVASSRITWFSAIRTVLPRASASA